MGRPKKIIGSDKVTISFQLSPKLLNGMDAEIAQHESCNNRRKWLELLIMEKLASIEKERTKK